MSNGQPTTASAIGESFDEVVLPHLDAAHRLAHRLMGNEHDADDVVQEASLRAFRYFRTFTGGNGRAWFLRIVRHTSWYWRSRGFQAHTDLFDEEQHSGARPASDPETLLLQIDDGALIERAMSHLPDRFRELLVLRELRGLSYREVADVMAIPMGSVMSGLSRARQAFRGAMNDELKRSGLPPRTHPRDKEAVAAADPQHRWRLVRSRDSEARRRLARRGRHSPPEAGATRDHLAPGLRVRQSPGEACET